MFDSGIKTASVLAATLALVGCDSGAFLAPGEDGPNEINGVVISSIALDTVPLMVEDDTVALHVTAYDELGNPVEDPSLVVEWSSSDATVATIQSTGGANGELITRNPGSTTLTVSYDQISTSTTIEVHNRPVDLVYVAGSGQAGAPGTTLSDSLTVRILDKRGDSVDGVVLNFTVVAGGGTVSPSAGTTDATGTLRTAWTLGSSGVQEVRALASENQPRVKKLHNAEVIFTATLEDTTVDVSSVTVTPDSAVVDTTGMVDLDAEVRDSRGRAVSTAAVSWASSDTTVARVDAEGLVTAVAEGQVLVSATAGGITGTSDITVASSSDGTLKVYASTDTLYGIGDTLTLRVEARNATGTLIANPDVVWSSSNPDIATVDNMGTVTSRALGTAVIAASAACCAGDFYDVTGAAGAPETVLDLQVASVGSDSVTLLWTEVGDGTGSPADYALRFDSPSLSWSPAHDSEVSVQGAVIGETVSYTVTGLATGTEYEFGLVSYRGTLNVDAVFGETSNFVRATTTRDTAAGGEVAYIAASPSSHTFTSIGATRQITATAWDDFDEIVPDVGFTFSSTDPSVVGVDSMGITTANAIGTAVVIVSAICCTDATPDTIQATVDTTAATPLFSDGFESGDLSYSGNGFSWSQNVEDNVYTDHAHNGSYARRFRYGPNASGEADIAELSFDFGSHQLTEMWVEYYLYVPSNFEHRADGVSGANNNKFFVSYAERYSSAGDIQFVIEYTRVNDTESNPRVICMTEGQGCLQGTIHAPMITAANVGGWMRVRVHAKAGVNGALEVWRDDTLVYSHFTDFIYSGGNNYWRNGYLMGWANSGFLEETDFFVDDFKVYDSNPGW